MRRLDLATASPADVISVTRRSVVSDDAVRRGAEDICRDVRDGGDAALAEAGRRFGGDRPGPRRVGTDELDDALESLEPETVSALRAAAANIEEFHRAQLPQSLEVQTAPGVSVTREWAPLRRVGAYVPGGKAAYPSSLLMTAIPARVAGVASIAVATPAAPDGTVQAVVLAAAAVAGVSEVHIMGGSQAIAALAYGTESIEPVDKIVGPGNAWVTAAKLAVFGTCGIDLPAGPSEALIVADHTAHPIWVAVDLLCQAEHGPDSPAVLVTTDERLAEAVEAEIARLLPRLERSAILEMSLERHGLVVLSPDRERAIDFANAYAAEHVSVVTEDAERDVKDITAAGSVYVGPYAAESAGDYATGANHVLPTGGLPRSYGPLSVEDFGSWRQVQRIDREGLHSLLPTIRRLAEAEGLTAHALAAAIRFSEEGTNP